MNNGSGIFNSSQVISGGNPTYIYNTDIDNDGDLDIFVFDVYTTGVYLYLNNGSGVFNLFSSYSFGVNNVFYPETMNLDGDGRSEIIFAKINSAVILKLSGNNLISSNLFTFTSELNSIKPGDLNNDGKTDFIATMTDSVKVMINNGNGTFNETSIFVSGYYPFAAPLFDIDDDRDLDLLVTVSNGPLKIFKNNGSGSFSFYSDLNVSTSEPIFFQQTIGDYDNDMDLDFALIKDSFMDFSLLKNNGSGGFQNFDFPYNSSIDFAISSGDFDNDGDLDLVLGDNGNISLMKNQAPVSAAPQITNLSPLQNAINADKSSDITAEFNTDMDSSTINSSNIRVIGSQTGSMNCVISYDAVLKKATINPNNDFKTGEEISVTLKSGIMNSSGLALESHEFKFTVAATQGSGLFSETISLTDTNMIITTGDVDGDGDIDFVGTFQNFFPGITGFRVYKNNGSGMFNVSSVIATSYQWDENTQFLVKLSDIDNDGDLDLVGEKDGIGSHLYSEFNDGSGNFGGGSIITFIEPLQEIKLGDFDNDGDLDIATINYGQGLKFSINNGIGQFHDTITGIQCNEVINYDDYDNDGKIDLILMVGTTLKLFSNNGNFLFTETSQLPSVTSKIISSDIDEDGDIDLIYSNGDAYLNQGNGIFIIRANVSLYPHFIADFDSDGDLDLVADNSSPNEISLFKNVGYGIFGYFSKICDKLNSSELLPGDYDGDGDIDILFGGINGVHVLFNFPQIPTAQATAAPLVGTNSTTFGTTNLTFAGNVSISAPLTVSFYNISPPQSGLPSGVVSVGNNFWSVENNNGVIFSNGQMSIPLSLLGGADPTTITWLKRSNPGDPWTDIGGSISGSNFISTIPFNTFSEFVLGNLNQSTLPVTCNVKLLLEGYYHPNIQFHDSRDTFTVVLRNAIAPFAAVDSAESIIDPQTFTGSFTFNNAPSGTYYLQLLSKNGIETWSKSGGEIYTRGATLNYDFTTSYSRAYGNNLVLKGEKYCIYSGDINQDAVIDGSDVLMVDNDAANFVTGYVNSDVDGDGFVDGNDLAIVDNNAAIFVSVVNP